MLKTKSFLSILLISLLFLNNCNLKKASNDTPLNGLERAKKNIKEGRGISIGNALKRGSTTYEFSTSNPMWRATLDILNFMPLNTVDYSGGIIITDWYTGENKNSESIKITIRFLTNEIRSDSLQIIVHQKKCAINENCTIKAINSNLKEELSKSIIKQAALLEKTTKK